MAVPAGAGRQPVRGRTGLHHDRAGRGSRARAVRPRAGPGSGLLLRLPDRLRGTSDQRAAEGHGGRGADRARPGGAVRGDLPGVRTDVPAGHPARPGQRRADRRRRPRHGLPGRPLGLRRVPGEGERRPTLRADRALPRRLRADPTSSGADRRRPGAAFPDALGPAAGWQRDHPPRRAGTRHLRQRPGLHVGRPVRLRRGVLDLRRDAACHGPVRALDRQPSGVVREPSGVARPRGRAHRVPADGPDHGRRADGVRLPGHRFREPAGPRHRSVPEYGRLLLVGRGRGPLRLTRGSQSEEGRDPAWGLHTADVSIALGDLVDLVAAQSAAWAERGGVASTPIG